MNNEQKKEQKINKWGRQIGYLAYKIMLLSGRDMAQIRGNGLVITVKKWRDVADECEYFEDNGKDEKLEKESGDKGQVEQGESTKECKEKTPEEQTLSDAAFQDKIKKIREGWKE